MSELNKAIGAWRGTAMMLNIVLGAGLLTLPGLAVKTAGADALSVWVISAFVAVPLLVVFAILGRNYPDAGGIAAFVKNAFGDFGYAAATFLFLGAVAVGLSGIALTGGHYAAATIGGPPALYGALLILGATGANLVSAELAARINAALASVILIILVAIAVACWWAVKPDLSQSVAELGLPNAGTFGVTFMMVFFAFTGWEVSANLSGEFKYPRKHFPIAMAASFIIAVVLYLVLALIVASAAPEAASEAPFAVILGGEFGPGGNLIVSAVSVLLIFANLSAAIWAVSRMVYSGATERLLPAVFSRLERGVPLRAVLVTTCVLLAVVSFTAVGYLNLEGLLGAAGLNFLLLYAAAAAALVRLSPKVSHASLGAFCVAVVLGLIFARGMTSMMYPAALVLCAGIAVWVKIVSPDPIKDVQT